MPMFLVRFSYTPESWAKLIAKPEDRRTAIAQLTESVGGTLHGFWYAFGEHDGYCIVEAPDNVAVSAVAMAVSAGGALNSLETTVLMSVEETISALKQAGSISYKAPGNPSGD